MRTIRRLRSEEHRDALFYLLENCKVSSPTVSDGTDIRMLQEFMTGQSNLPRQILYGAFEDEIPIGLLARDAAGGRLSLLCIIPTHRRCGIGRQLFDFAVEDRPVETLMIQAPSSAIPFLERLGFTTSVSTDSLNGLLPTPMQACGIRLKGERLLLRPWRPSDADSLVRQANDIQIWNNLRDTFPHPYTRADADIFIALATAKIPTMDFAIVIREEAVGCIGHLPDPEAFESEIGYWLSTAHQGHGVMSEAVALLTKHLFTTTPLRRLHATVFGHNTASMRVLEKTGFHPVDIIRQGIIKNGRLTDLHHYERTRTSDAVFDRNRVTK